MLLAFLENDSELRLPRLHVHLTSTFPVQVMIHKIYVIVQMQFGEDEWHFHIREAVRPRPRKLLVRALIHHKNGS